MAYLSVIFGGALWAHVINDKEDWGLKLEYMKALQREPSFEARCCLPDKLLRGLSDIKIN